jgi:hypothetical protein
MFLSPKATAGAICHAERLSGAALSQGRYGVSTHRSNGFWLFAVGWIALGLCAVPAESLGAGGADPKTLREIQREIQTLEQARTQDLGEIKRLSKRVEQLETENAQLKTSSTQIKTETTQTTQMVKQLQTQQSSITPSEFDTAFGHYLGTHTFTVTGAAGVQYVFDQQSSTIDGLSRQSQNTFFVDWEPMILYRPTDWLLFQGVISTAFGSTGRGVNLSTADFQIFLNNYLTIEAGLFDQPFGDWLEAQSPMWVNRFVTAPLPFGVEPVIPPAEIGLQLRGGLRWGDLGQDLDYTVWGGNGPNYTEPVLGATAGSPTAIASSQTNGKSIGARFRVYPLPVDTKWGRLELGASTYNGKWLQGNWLNSWGLDYNYFIGNLQTRGEWVQAYRQMPAGQPADNRQGWYVQFGYFLTGLKVPGLPDEINDYLQRLEPLVRYSGVNQRGVASDDIQKATGVGLGGIQVGLIPNFGINGSPALYAPHAREVALGLDYWIAPSIVLQNELDIELPRSGGVFVAGDGTTTPAGSIPNDKAFLSQFTVGF